MEQSTKGPTLLMYFEDLDTWLQLADFEPRDSLDCVAPTLKGADLLVLGDLTPAPLPPGSPPPLKVTQAVVGLRVLYGGRCIVHTRRVPDPSLDAFSKAERQVLDSHVLVLALSQYAPTSRLQQLLPRDPALDNDLPF